MGTEAFSAGDVRAAWRCSGQHGPRWVLCPQHSMSGIVPPRSLDPTGEKPITQLRPTTATAPVSAGGHEPSHGAKEKGSPAASLTPQRWVGKAGCAKKEREEKKDEEEEEEGSIR